MLQRIVEDRSTPRTREALAKEHNVSPHQLAQLMYSSLELTVRGLSVLDRATQAKCTVPLTPAVVETIAQRAKDRNIEKTEDLVKAAREFDVPFHSLRLFVLPRRGLTRLGEALVAQPWTERRAGYTYKAARRAGHDLSALGPTPLRGPTIPAASGKSLRITADLLLGILDDAASIAKHGSLRGVARHHRLSDTALYPYISAGTWTLLVGPPAVHDLSDVSLRLLRATRRATRHAHGAVGTTTIGIERVDGRRRMFPTFPAASTTTPAPFLPAASARAPWASAMPARPEVAALRDEIVAALHDGSPLDRHVLLPLFPEMQRWPLGLPIDLVTEGELSGQRFGPPLWYTDADGPIYVKMCANGRYATDCSLATPPGQWWDCGAVTGPDSLFHAVLVGMQLRDANRHAEFTHALQPSHAGYRTDVQGLRDQLAHELANAHPPLMRVLEELAVSRGSAGVHATPPGQALHAVSGVADFAGLQRVARMSPDELLEAAGLRGLRDHHSVFYASLRAGAGVRRAAHARAHGAMGTTRKLDRHLLLDILKEVWAAEPRTFAELARDYEVNQERLYDVMLTNFVPTPRGLDMIMRKPRHVLPHPTQEVLQVVRDMRAEGRLPSLNHFFAVAQLCNVSYAVLYKYIHANGLTASGRELLSRDPASASDDTTRKRKPVDASVRQQGAGTDVDVAPHASKRSGYVRPLTASTLLEVVNELRRPGGRDSTQVAHDHSLTSRQLDTHLYANGVPKALGLDLLYRARRGKPDSLIDPSVVDAVDRLWKDKWIWSPYHLLVVAYAFNVSFERLQRYVSAGHGLTTVGSDYVVPLRNGAQASDVQVPWHLLPDPSGPLWLHVDANLFVVVHVDGNRIGTASLVETSDAPIVSAPWLARPASNATATHAPPDADLLDIRLDAWDASPEHTTLSDPELPDDLMSLTVEDLLSPMPERSRDSPKHPRWGP